MYVYYKFALQGKRWNICENSYTKPFNDLSRHLG